MPKQYKGYCPIDNLLARRRELRRAIDELRSTIKSQRYQFYFTSCQDDAGGKWDASSDHLRQQLRALEIEQASQGGML